MIAEEIKIPENLILPIEFAEDNEPIDKIDDGYRDAEKETPDPKINESDKSDSDSSKEDGSESSKQ